MKVGEVVKGLPGATRGAVHNIQSQLQLLIDGNGKWVVLAESDKANLGTTSLVYAANKRRVFVDVAVRMVDGKYRLFGRLVKVSANGKEETCPSS